mgnify:FL=1
MCLRLSLLLALFLCAPLSFAHALDLRPTLSPWLEDGTNTYLRVQRNVCIGIGPTATDALSLCTAPVASSTRALVNLSNTALSGASANGTYLGANPAACTGDFLNFQVANVSKASLSCAGALTVTTLSTPLTNTHIFVGNASNIATDVAMSGDATMANTGALTIANGAVTSSKLASSLGLVTPDIGAATGTSLTLSGTLAVKGATLTTTTGISMNSGNTALTRGLDSQIAGTGAANYAVIGSASGAGTINYGVYASASGAGTNYGLYINAGDVRIPALASASGVRYLCIDTAGKFVSQAAACVGT